jgi:hypothetical protein
MLLHRRKKRTSVSVITGNIWEFGEVILVIGAAPLENFLLQLEAVSIMNLSGGTFFHLKGLFESDAPFEKQGQLCTHGTAAGLG